MKRLICRTLLILTALAALAGCGTMQDETAMQWLQRQPVWTDP